MDCFCEYGDEFVNIYIYISTHAHKFIKLQVIHRHVGDSMFLDKLYCDTIHVLNHLTPNGHYMGRTAQLTSRCCILYIYSANIRTEYFKHAA